MRHPSKNAADATSSECAAPTYHRRISYERETTWCNPFPDYGPVGSGIPFARAGCAGNHPDGYADSRSDESLGNTTMARTQAGCCYDCPIRVADVSDARCG